MLPRSERVRIHRRSLKARGICIDCDDHHTTGGMRCSGCAEYNRGGPYKVRGRPAMPDAAAQLERAMGINTAALPEFDRQRVYVRRYYWRQRVAKLKKNKEFCLDDNR